VSVVGAPDLWPWLALAGLGAYHGLNPAMGWLFAVALGLQERSRRAVLRALLPIALGHEASIALVVLLVGGLELVAAPQVLRAAGALVLVLFGLYKFLRPRSHPRWVGMRVTPRELVLWSFLMSSAHGAGLMLFPVLLGLPAHEHADVLPAVALGGVAAQDVAAVLLHTLAMLLAMGAVAVLVYEKLGLGVLRRAWVNLDLVWAAAVVIAGAATLFT
jgi:hypothetical protein